MAHFEKYRKGSAYNTIAHDRREEGYAEKNADRSRSHLNYNLCDVKDEIERIEELLKIAKESGATIRDDTNVICSLIVTLPKDFPENEELRRQFFIGCYDFMCDEFGKENMISAWIHLDEAQPHIHIKFCPVREKIKKYKDGREKTIYSFDAKNCINRTYLRTFHNRLEDFLTDYLGFKPSILNGATKDGHKTINELKKESERLKKQKEYINKDAWLIIAEQKKIINEYWKDYKNISQSYWTAYKAKKQIISNSIWELKKGIRGAEKELQQGLDFIGNMSYGLLYAIFKLIGAFSLLHRENVLQRELKALESEFEALETTRRKVSNYQHNAKEKLSKSDLEGIEEALENWERVAMGMNAKMRDTLRQRETEIVVPEREEKEEDILL